MLQWDTLLSATRYGHPADLDPNRSDFHRDYDRIVFSTAFRRLGRKTQVHPFSVNDHVHSRLTHSIEVSSVGRSLAITVYHLIKKYLPKYINWTPHYEEVEHNPYLDSFYEDMQRWSFNIQIFFLNSRFRQVMDIRNSGKDVIQDRTIYEDAHIFAANLYAMGLMETRDFENYQSLFELMTKFLQPPDLLIYLRASVPTLIRHIAKRNREFEQSISISYLTNLNERYEKWISGYNDGKLLIIDTDDIELENPEDLSTVVDRIEASLNGLF